jgi:TPR repeat protein
MAADQNFPPAALFFALACQSGLGVSVDFILAARYLKLAADCVPTAALAPVWIREYKDSIDSSVSEAQARYGYCLRKGNGVAVDLDQSARYFEMAASRTNRQAVCQIGLCFFLGLGVSADLTKAATYFKHAAEQGWTEGQLFYACCLHGGCGVAADLVRAAHFFKMAADNDSASAAFDYSYYLLHGLGVARDPTSAAKYLKLSADHGYAEGQEEYGRLVSHAGGVGYDAHLALSYLTLAAAAGRPNAQFLCGRHHMDGFGVARNLKQAVWYYRHAADQEFGPAESCLGQCFEFGFGVSPNLETAVQYYERAASHGSDEAFYFLGLCLEFGKGIGRDPSRAYECYEKAAVTGERGSRNSYAFCCQYGFGARADLVEGALAYKQSADEGNSNGSFHYAICVQYGRGLDIDLDDALDYYEKYLESGSRRETDEFRCRRGSPNTMFELKQFPGLVDPQFEVLQECRALRPAIPPRAMSDFLTARQPGHQTITRLWMSGSSTVELVEGSGVDRYVIKYVQMTGDPVVFLRELESLSSLRHVCVVGLLGYVLSDREHRAEIHLEWAAHGSLEHVLREVKMDRRPNFWTSTNIAIIISGIVLGLRYVHSKGFIHQDLKPSNILINGQCRALIADFGAARQTDVDATPDGVTGTVHYAAPEQFEEILPTTKIDVFAFGLILYEILVGSPVFGLNEPPFTVIPKVRSGYVPNIPDSVCSWVGELIVRCLSSNPEARPSFQDILMTMKRHDFSILAGVDRSIVRGYVNGVEEWEQCDEV